MVWMHTGNLASISISYVYHISGSSNFCQWVLIKVCKINLETRSRCNSGYPHSFVVYRASVDLSLGVFIWYMEYPDHNYFTVWLPDGNVRYYEGKHTIFLIVVYVIIISGFAYTILLLSWQWLVQAPRWKILRWTKNTKLNAFITTVVSLLDWFTSLH